MIVRNYIACATCGQNHIVRIGMGHDERQEHRFSCSSCGEQICVALEVDFKLVRHRVCLGENAANGTQEDAPIINLDASFPVPEAEQGKDLAFPRLRQMHRLLMEQQARVDKTFGPGAFERGIRTTPSRYPGFVGEWKQLRRAWSLRFNKKDKLSQRLVDDWSRENFPGHPLNGLNDWLWRFAMRFGGVEYEDRFKKIIAEFLRARAEQPTEFQHLLEYYSLELRERHQALHFEICKQFFDHYSEYGQVHIYETLGMELPSDFHATSQGYDLTKMFYGNAYETLTEAVELFALLNNVLFGRAYDVFANITLDQYRKLDKAGRCNAFAMNASLCVVAEALDNQLRNSSHHATTSFNPRTSKIRYRSGKGGTGEVHEISYTDYLSKCCKLMSAILLMLRVELILDQEIQTLN